MHRAMHFIPVIALLTSPGASAQPALIANPPANPPAVDVELEGTITAIIDTGDAYQITVLDVPVRVDEDTAIFSPSAVLTRWQLLQDPLPGRSVPGFLNGSAIVIGSASNGAVRADILMVEPAENVLAGPAGDQRPDGPSILGIPVVLLSDPRMPGSAMNELGFQIDPSTIAPGDFTVAEGYMGEDHVFYAHLIEGNGEILGPPNQTSITRARCALDAALEVRGGSTTPDGTARLFDADTGDLLAETSIEPDEDMTGLGTYRFRIEIDTCPSRVRVENSNGSFAETTVEIF